MSVESVSQTTCRYLWHFIPEMALALHCKVTSIVDVTGYENNSTLLVLLEQPI